MPMYAFKVGEPFPEFKGRPDATHFNLDDSGAIMIMLMNRPTDAEIDYMRSEQPAEFRFVVLQGILFFLAKFGGGMWQDMPYHPSLDGLPNFQTPEEGQGLGMTCILADTVDGTVKSLRLIGLGTKFTEALISAVRELAATPIDHSRFNEMTQITQRMYSTKEMVGLAKDYYKVK